MPSWLPQWRSALARGVFLATTAAAFRQDERARSSLVNSLAIRESPELVLADVGKVLAVPVAGHHSSILRMRASLQADVLCSGRRERASAANGAIDEALGLVSSEP